jgi:hypothetical protein
MSTNYASQRVWAAVISLAKRVASVVGGMASTVIRWVLIACWIAWLFDVTSSEAVLAGPGDDEREKRRRVALTS